MSRYIVETRNLTKQYGTQKSVADLNLHIAPGRIYGLLGRNGAGKTTAMKMLLGLTQPTSGEVLLWGTPLPGHEKELLPRIGSLIETPGFYYQRLVLDQGYWPDSLMTAPSDEDLRRDIELAKEMGFNGCRKHQKAEDPRFLYWADRLGYLVWGEIGSCAAFSEEAARRLTEEWAEAITRDYNHPSIVAWVTVNESWGVPGAATDTQQQALMLALYYQAKTLDTTRLVVGNDGWEMARTDLCAIHNYNHGAPDDQQAHEAFARSLSTREALLQSMPAARPIYADGYQNRGEPILLTEFGGISMRNDTEGAWGYTNAGSSEELLAEYRRILQAINDSQALYGFCYTQLCDVEQETNGLYTYDRRPKVAPDAIRRINESVKGF